MRVKMLTVGAFQSNAFIVSCEETKEGIVVDACDDARAILDDIAQNGITIRAIVTTHAHIDHVTALAEVAEAVSAPILMHQSELPIYESVPQQALLFGLPAPTVVDIDRFVRGGDQITFGKLVGEVIETPGHSPGGISIVFPGESPPKVFVGDVLFRGSIGRTDLYGADHEQMMETLRESIMTLPDDTIVYPGHGEETTIGHEKHTNPFLLQLGSS